MHTAKRLNRLFFLLGTLIGLSLFQSKPSLASWDYQFGFSGRSLPFGGIFSANFGYGLLLWGEDPLSKMPLVGPAEGIPVWQYGYVRPNLLVETIGITNRVSGEIEVFPVSILGLSVGHTFRSKANQSFQFDCSQIQCGGSLSRNYVRGRLILGLDKVFGIFSGQYTAVSDPQGTLPFLDENQNLLGSVGTDQNLQSTVALGYTLSQRWNVGVSTSVFGYTQSKEFSQNHLLFANHYFDRWGIFLGAGTFRSTHQELSPTIAGWIQLMGRRPYGIF